MADSRCCSRGLWNQAGVPHKGWVWVRVYRAEPEMVTCDMCRAAKIRFVHVLRHPDYPSELRVGRLCACRMTNDYATPKRGEAALMRQLGQSKASPVEMEAA